MLYEVITSQELKIKLISSATATLKRTGGRGVDSNLDPMLGFSLIVSPFCLLLMKLLLFVIWAIKH